MNKAKDNNTSSGTGTIENIKLLKGEWLSRLSLALAPNIKAGFPSPADDYLRDSLDFNRDLIKNPEATSNISILRIRRRATSNCNLPTPTIRQYALTAPTTSVCGA